MFLHGKLYKHIPRGFRRFSRIFSFSYSNWVRDNLDIRSVCRRKHSEPVECISDFCVLYLPLFIYCIFMKSLITQFYLFTSILSTFLSSSMEYFLHILSALRGYENGCKYLNSLIRRGEKCAECDIGSLGA